VTIRILIADDQPIIRRGLQTILQTEPDFLVVGEAASATDAVSLAESLKPDVVLMDIQMPPSNSIMAMREITEHRWSRVIVLTTFDTEGNVVETLKAGASGFLLKDVEIPELAKAIRDVVDGQAVVQPDLIARYLPALIAPKQQEILTSRELEILRLVATGKTNAHIAEYLYVSESTIKNHLTNIFTKLEVHNRTEAIDRARHLRLFH
jgi:DNA-binding NarL/FixJ family response regulator